MIASGVTSGRGRVCGRWLSAAMPLLALLGQPFMARQACGGPILLDLKPRTIFGVDMPGTNPNRLISAYRTDNGLGTVYLDPVSARAPLTSVQMLAANQNLYFNFFNALDRQFGNFNGWKIVGNPQKFSEGSLLIHTYDAEDDPGVAGISPPSVGARIDIEYKPTGADPTVDMHWIAVFSDNHSSATNVHGDRENYVETFDPPNPRNPYYETIFRGADNRNFQSIPFRIDVENDHDWVAGVFLASGPSAAGAAAAPAQITVYNDSGIFWGWKNRFVRNDANLALHDLIHGEFLDKLPLDEFALFHDAFHAELDQLVVPEPGAVALTLCGCASLLVCAKRLRLQAGRAMKRVQEFGVPYPSPHLWRAAGQTPLSVSVWKPSAMAAIEGATLGKPA